MTIKNEQISTEKANTRSIILAALAELRSTFAAFIQAPRALWGINFPYILEGLVYFGILTILGKYCSENVNLSDVHSGWVYGAVTGGITFAMLLLGGVTDKIGVRRSLSLSLGAMVVGRLFISLSGTLSLGQGLWSPMFFMMMMGLFLMVVAYGLYMPAAYAGVKRYTNPKTAAVGYAVLYGLMNLGAFIFGPLSSFTRHHAQRLFPPNGLTAVFWVLAIITVISFLFTLIMITRRVDRIAVEQIAKETQEMTGTKSQNKSTSDKPVPRLKFNNRLLFVFCFLSLSLLIVLILSLSRQIHIPNILASILFSCSLILSGWEYLRHRHDHPFRDIRFVAFIFVLIPVQTLFAHNWLTIPYYLDRAFIGTWVSDHFEILSNLNPIIVFFVSPVIAGLTPRANIYKMMIIGTFVMSLPTFLLASGPIASLFVLYIVLMSIGEAMWQPRFLQWIAEIAPEGKTGAYMGIGQFPWFLTKLITSLYSGYFVAKYIPKPETGLPMQTGLLWLFYSLIAVITPITLLLARRWMQRDMRTKA